MSKEHKDIRELRIAADPVKVWNAWALPQHITGWFADRAEGEPTPGSTITHFFDKFGMALPHEVVEAIVGERLVLKGVGPGGIPFVQEIRVRADGGETVLELVHSGFGDDADFSEEYEGMDSGWKLALAVLKRYVEQFYGRARTSYFAMQPAVFEWDGLRPYFTEEAALSRWLTSSGSVGDAGDAVSLVLADGQPVTGTVLARSSREVVLSWDEIDGSLELKAFGMGPGVYAVSLRAASWSPAAPAVDEVESWMAESCVRLAAALAE